MAQSGIIRATKGIDSEAKRGFRCQDIATFLRDATLLHSHLYPS